MDFTGDERVQVRFTLTDADGLSFTDALHFFPAEYQVLSSKELDALKQARFDAWKAVRATPAVAVELTQEQVDEQINSFVFMQDFIQGELLRIAPPERMAELLVRQQGVLDAQKVEVAVAVATPLSPVLVAIDPAG